MKDSEARSLILRRLYDARDTARDVSFSSFTDVRLNRIALVNRFAVARLLQQLSDEGFISWNVIHTRAGYVDGVAHITAKGEHAVQHPGTTDPSTVFGQNIAARDSPSMQIGNRNIQSAAIDVEIEKPQAEHPPLTAEASPVEVEAHRGKIEIDGTAPLLGALLRQRKHAPLVEKLIVAFERSNRESTSAQRSKVFYELLAEILADL